MSDQLSYISKEYIAQFLPKNPIIIDAGAHKGRDTLEFIAQWPLCTVHAFEPVPALFEVLKTRTAEIKNVHVYPFALSEKMSIQTFYLSDHKKNAVSSLLEPDQIKQQLPAVQFNHVNVQTITLDDWAIQCNISTVDLIWLDVQGAELAVFKGATELLQSVKAIHCEVSLVERYKNQPLYPEIKAFLATRGFTLQAEALYRQTWGNSLFIK
jgi:FkbM family methyltransferase